MRELQTQQRSSLRYLGHNTKTLLTQRFGFRIIAEAGSGFAGTVIKCAVQSKDSESEEKVVAVKAMCKKRIKASLAENEAMLLKQTKGPNVVQYVGSLESLDGYLLVTEFCARGDLHGILDDLDNGYLMARNYLLGVVSGLESLHEKFIAHCDIKMKNILITDKNVAKIADFGFAVKHENANARMAVCQGTKDYWAPEMRLTFPSYDPFKADIYALGVTFVGACVKKPIKRKYDNIHAVVEEFKDPYHRQLFFGMLETAPEDRWDFSTIRSNVWLKDCQTPSPSPP